MKKKPLASLDIKKTGETTPKPPVKEGQQSAKPLPVISTKHIDREAELLKRQLTGKLGGRSTIKPSENIIRKN